VKLASKGIKMQNLTAIIHQGDPDEGGYWATCIEVPGANGQGETRQECIENLKEAVRLLLEVEREEALRCDPKGEEVPIAI
jgi:predicted RNase H-like HicB family nuclease